ncbi:MAG: hypothetical protein HY329_19440 [Chloroflexi bacterium]|nr:hypothetical protein [Chloroflexota bacterium]
MLAQTLVKGSIMTVVLLVFSIAVAWGLQSARPIYDVFAPEAGPAAVQPCTPEQLATLRDRRTSKQEPTEMLSVSKVTEVPIICWEDGVQRTGNEYAWLAGLSLLLVLVGDAICLFIFFRRPDPLRQRSSPV